MPHSISRDEVAHVANLAQLRLDDDELDSFTEQLTTLLEHARDVASLDLDHLAPTIHPMPQTNVTRPDEVRPSLDREEVLAQAPSVEDHQFRVPPALGEAP